MDVRKMTLAMPTDPYDPAWIEFNRQNPGLRKGVGADAAPDPEPAKVEDGGDPPADPPKAEDPPKDPPADPADKPKDPPKDNAKTADELAAEIAALKEEKARLLKDTMKNKDKRKTAEEELTSLKGQLGDTLGEMTLEEVKEALQKQAEAEEAALQAKGDFDTLKSRMIAEHKKELEKVTGSTGAQVKELKGKLEDAENQIRKLLVTNSFAGSSYLGEELTLTPAKAEKLYGDSFKVENKDGNRVVVAYLNGEPLVDGSGNALTFEDAFKEIVSRDPEKETIIRPKAKPGAGSNADNKGGAELPKTPARGVDAIKQGLSQSK